MLLRLCYVPIGSYFQRGGFAEGQGNNCFLINPPADQKGNQKQRKEEKGGKRSTT